MTEPIKAAACNAALAVFEAFSQMLIDAGLGMDEATDLLQRGYIRAAQSRCVDPDSVSQVAAVSCLTRKKASAVMSRANTDDTPPESGQQGAECVLNGWHNDQEFLDDAGSPRLLPIRGEQGSFVALVRRYCSEERAKPILSILERLGAVRRLDDGRLQALRRSAAPISWTPEGISVVAIQVAEQLATLRHNLKSPNDPRFVRRLVNTRIDPEQLPGLIQQLERQAKNFAATVDETLNHRKYTLAPNRRGRKAARLGISLYTIQGFASIVTPDVAGKVRK